MRNVIMKKSDMSDTGMKRKVGMMPDSKRYMNKS